MINEEIDRLVAEVARARRQMRRDAATADQANTTASDSRRHYEELNDKLHAEVQASVAEKDRQLELAGSL